MSKTVQPTENPSNDTPGKETILGELLALSEQLRIGHRGPFNKLAGRLDQSADDRPFVPPVIREPESAALVAEMVRRLEAVRQADPAIFNLFNARLKRGLENIAAGRALTLNPPRGSHTGHQKYFATLLRGETLEPPDPIEPGKFYPLNRIIARHGDSSAGWCMWFADDSGGAYGHGRDASGLTFYRTPGEKTEAENARLRQNIAAAHAALRADTLARRR